MKILIVSQYYYPERISVTNIAKTLVKQGHQVTVITGKPNYGFNRILNEYKNIDYEEIDGVKIHRVNLKPRKYSKISIALNYLSFHRNAKRFVRHFKEEFDIVLPISLSPVISVSPALLYAKKHNVPCVLYCQDIWPESVVAAGVIRRNSLSYKFLYKWSKGIYSRCDKIIISSPSFKDYFENELNIKNKGFNVIYQPAIESQGDEEDVKYDAKHNFVYAGNIGKLQLVDMLVDALKYVKSKDVKLHILGVGTELNKILNKIKKEKLEEKVIYEGSFPIEKAEAYYQNADALIVSLKNEGVVGLTVPNKAIQFLKYGKPIICVSKGDARKLLSNTGGCFFSNEDAKDIAEQIDNICERNKKDLLEVGLRNKKYFNDNFTIEKMVYHLVEELISVKK